MPPLPKTYTMVLDTLVASREATQNFDIAIDEVHNMLVIRVPLAGGGGRRTASGRNLLIATSGGNRLISGTNLRVGLNVYEETNVKPSFSRIVTDPTVDDDVHPDHRPPSEGLATGGSCSDYALPQRRRPKRKPLDEDSIDLGPASASADTDTDSSSDETEATTDATDATDATDSSD